MADMQNQHLEIDFATLENLLRELKLPAWWKTALL